jgi:hypothetical protein
MTVAHRFIPRPEDAQLSMDTSLRLAYIDRVPPDELDMVAPEVVPRLCSLPAPEQVEVRCRLFELAGHGPSVWLWYDDPPAPEPW